MGVLAGTATVEINLILFSEIKYILMSYGMAILFLSVYHKDIQVHEGTYRRIFIAVFFYGDGEFEAI